MIPPPRLIIVLVILLSVIYQQLERIDNSIAYFVTNAAGMKKTRKDKIKMMPLALGTLTHLFYYYYYFTLLYTQE
jgi:uncharacterized protein YebE (UPF0316 family)